MERPRKGAVWAAFPFHGGAAPSLSGRDSICQTVTSYSQRIFLVPEIPSNQKQSTKGCIGLSRAFSLAATYRYVST
jgi:hypothetical protein